MEANEALKQSCILGTFCLILLTANSSFSLIITQLHEQDGNRELGPFLLACYYGSFLLSNIVSPSLKWNYKTMMTYSPFFYVVNFLVSVGLPFTESLILKYVLTAIGSTIGGFGAALLWTSLGGYMHLLCKVYQVQETKGKYFGTFTAIYCIQSITGALTTTFCLGYFTVSTYFFIVTGIAIASSLFCHFMVHDLQNCQYSEINQELPEKFSFKRAVTKIYNFYPKMVYTLPLIFLDGIAIGFINSSMTHLIPPSATDKQANIRAGFCFVIYGIGSILGGYASSSFTDCFSLKRTGNLNIYLFMTTCLASYLSVGCDSYGFVCVVFFLWGLSLYYIEGWMMVICSRIYGGALQSFAINKQFHSCSFVLYEIFIMITENRVDLKMVLPFLSIFVVPVSIGLGMLVKACDDKQDLVVYQEFSEIKQKISPIHLEAQKLVGSEEQ